MEPNASGDYQYDEAHEAVMQGSVDEPPTTEDPSEQVRPHSDMPSVQPDGDYSYDMAHDAIKPATNE